MGHPNEDRIRAGMKAFGSGDLEALKEFFAEDAVLHAPGRHHLAGDHRGRDKVFEQFARTFQETDGTFRLDLHDVLANDEHGVFLAHVTGQRRGRRLDDNGVTVLHLRDGRVTEAWLHPGDQHAIDEFFGQHD